MDVFDAEMVLEDLNREFYVRPEPEPEPPAPTPAPIPVRIPEPIFERPAPIPQPVKKMTHTISTSTDPIPTPRPIPIPRKIPTPRPEPVKIPTPRPSPPKQQPEINDKNNFDLNKLMEVILAQNEMLIKSVLSKPPITTSPSTKIEKSDEVKKVHYLSCSTHVFTV